MRISLNWLRQYIDISESVEELADILTSLGLEVESVETVEELKGGLKNIVVAEIVECWKHPNADRLHLTKVNPGNGEILQVVCGAPNVAAGQKVFLAQVGASIFPKKGDPFVIKAGKIRGEVSEGMLCAEDELGLSENHEGLLLLDSNAIPGTPAADYLKLKTDVYFEIGLTPNRADATSHLGVARDLLAWYRVHKDPAKQLRQIELGSLDMEIQGHEMKVQVLNPVLCPRYSGICISGIEVKESPDWLQKAIRSMDLNPINNVVDVTNYILYELGQPLHAFDYDQIKNHSIIVDTLDADTKFVTLDGVERSLRSNDLMICDGEKKGLCIAGVFGGLNSGISELTTTIFLESAHFNASTVRKSSMAHNLRTQSARCFEKGSDPNLTIYALQRACYLLKKTCEAQISSNLIDLYPVPIQAAKIKMNVNQAIQLSGMNLDLDKLKQVLFALNMELEDLQDGFINVFVPTNKPDVLRMPDVVEEVCRVYGFENIPIPEKMQISFPKNEDSLYTIRKEIAGFLSANNLQEIMSLSLMRSGICNQSGLFREEDLVIIHNTSNIHLNAMKPSICFGGLEAIQYNSNRQQTDLSFYEMAKSYVRKGDRIQEKAKLGIWLCGLQNAALWSDPKPASQNFYQIKAVIESILHRLQFPIPTFESIENKNVFEWGLEYKSETTEIIQFGKLQSKLLAIFDIKKEVFYAEIDLEALAAKISNKPAVFTEFSKFLPIKRDLALILDQSVNFSELQTIAYKHSKNLLKSVQLFDIYENAEQIGSGKKSYALSFTFENHDRQMSSEEMETLMNELILIYKKEVNAIVRQ